MFEFIIINGVVCWTRQPNLGETRKLLPVLFYQRMCKYLHAHLVFWMLIDFISLILVLSNTCTHTTEYSEDPPIFGIDEFINSSCLLLNQWNNATADLNLDYNNSDWLTTHQLTYLGRYFFHWVQTQTECQFALKKQLFN